jgi:small subunit ribosomal protein S6
LTPTREYELVLMLDPDITEERREQITAEARTRIESGGSLKQDTAWGMRKLAYEIEQRTEADYRFFRFETDGGLLDDLNHNLRIADGVLRFRIFKVDPRSPGITPPAAMSAGAPARSARRPQAAPDREEAAEPAAAEPAPESAQEDEAPTEEPPEESDQSAPQKDSEPEEESP